MTDHSAEQAAQSDLFETESAQALLDQLLIDSRLYTKSKDYKELLDFAIRLPNVAPFNAMLLQIQKPGLKYVASAYDRWISTPAVVVYWLGRIFVLDHPYGLIVGVGSLPDSTPEHWKPALPSVMSL